MRDATAHAGDRVPGRSLEDLERAAIRTEELAEALPCLLRAPDVREALVLSTCNRIEFYTWAKDPDAAAEQIRLFLEDLKGLPMGWTRPRSIVLTGDDVIRHLFEVTAGLDSMITGESEIQGQVRAAYKTAAVNGALGPHLHGLFRWALEAGKRTRSTTGLARPASRSRAPAFERSRRRSAAWRVARSWSSATAGWQQPRSAP